MLENNAVEGPSSNAAPASGKPRSNQPSPLAGGRRRAAQATNAERQAADDSVLFSFKKNVMILSENKKLCFFVGFVLSGRVVACGRFVAGQVAHQGCHLQERSATRRRVW